jgi:hypothetical protein
LRQLLTSIIIEKVSFVKGLRSSSDDSGEEPVYPLDTQGGGMVTQPPIPKAIALQLCAEIRK